jgi:hypothetical protein
MLPCAVNIGLYYIGLADFDNLIRTAVSMVGHAIVLLCSIVVFIKLWRDEKYSIIFLIKFLAIPIVYAIFYMIAIISRGFSTILVTHASQFVALSLPVYVVAVYCARYRCGITLLRGIEKWGVVLLPAAIGYIMRVLFLSEIISLNFPVTDLGIFSYLTLAYYFLPPFVCSLLLITFNKMSTKVYLLRTGVIIIFCAAIVASMTRGALICVAFVTICILLYALITRHNRKTAVINTGVVILTTVIVFTMPLTVSVLQNMVQSIQQGVQEAQGTQGTQGVQEAQKKDKKSIKGVQVRLFTAEYEMTGKDVDTGEYIIISNPKTLDKLILDDKKVDNEYRFDRPALYYLALGEFNKSKIFGMGSLAFQEKYNGYYPHNMLLEFISELGLIIGGAVILFIAWLFIRLLLRTKKDKNAAYMFLYICAFIPMLMVSGTIWCSPMLLFASGFALFTKKITE